MSSPVQENPPQSAPVYVVDWRSVPPGDFHYTAVPRRPSLKTLFLAGLLFLLTLCTCLVAGTHFAFAYANHQALSWQVFEESIELLYCHPISLLSGLPFALTLMAILLAHELGHFFACRYHRIRTTYPFFIPFPSLIGTFGAFILIRSPIRTTRALFDVGASGPFVGFLFAVPALLYGVLHAQFVPGLADPNRADAVFGVPLLLQLFSALFHPGISPENLLLHPIGRAAWVGLFATALNLLPAGQLDGGHILRSINPRLHYVTSWLLPAVLLALAFFGHWQGWYVWASLLFVIRFFRVPHVYDPVPLDPARRFGAFLALFLFLLTFIPAPIVNL